MAGRVRWFLGFAKNSGGYSLPMIGTPCEVPEPRKINEKATMSLFLWIGRTVKRDSPAAPSLRSKLRRGKPAGARNQHGDNRGARHFLTFQPASGLSPANITPESSRLRRILRKRSACERNCWRPVHSF